MSCFCQTTHKLSNTIKTRTAEHCAAPRRCYATACGIKLVLKMRRLDRLICLFYNSRARLRCASEGSGRDDWWCCCFRPGESRGSFLFLHVREYCNSGRLKRAPARCGAPPFQRFWGHRLVSTLNFIMATFMRERPQTLTVSPRKAVKMCYTSTGTF